MVNNENMINSRYLEWPLLFIECGFNDDLVTKASFINEIETNISFNLKTIISTLNRNNYQKHFLNLYTIQNFEKNIL